MRTMTSLVVCTLVLALALGSADARKKKMKKGCSKDHSLVGKKGKLVTLEHEVAGKIKILDDCSFRATLTYDGTGPDVFWYGAKTVEGLDEGIIMDSITGVHDKKRVTVKLPKGTTWDDSNVLSVWCREFGVDFGHVEFEV